MIGGLGTGTVTMVLTGLEQCTIFFTANPKLRHNYILNQAVGQNDSHES